MLGVGSRDSNLRDSEVVDEPRLGCDEDAAGAGVGIVFGEAAIDSRDSTSAAGAVKVAAGCSRVFPSALLVA